METIKSLLLVLRESQSLLSPNRNISQDSRSLSDKILSFFLTISGSSLAVQESLNVVLKHHLLLSQENNLFHFFLSPPGSVVDVHPSLITCHVNTMLVMSCFHHCYMMGCLPQPIAISKHDHLVSIVYTSGSTGFAKGTLVFVVSICIHWHFEVSPQKFIFMCCMCISDWPENFVHSSLQ